MQILAFCSSSMKADTVHSHADTYIHMQKLHTFIHNADTGIDMQKLTYAPKGAETYSTHAALHPSVCLNIPSHYALRFTKECGKRGLMSYYGDSSCSINFCLVPLYTLVQFSI